MAAFLRGNAFKNAVGRSVLHATGAALPTLPIVFVPTRSMGKTGQWGKAANHIYVKKIQEKERKNPTGKEHLFEVMSSRDHRLINHLYPHWQRQPESKIKRKLRTRREKMEARDPDWAPGTKMNATQYIFTKIATLQRMKTKSNTRRWVAKLKNAGALKEPKAMTAIVKKLGSQKLAKDILLSLKEMEANGSPPDAHVYNTAIKGLAVSKRLPQAVALFEEMKVKNVPRDIFTYNCLISGIAELKRGYTSSEFSGFYKVALNAFEEMQSEGIKPDERTFDAILLACQRGLRRDPDEKKFAEELVRLTAAMQEAGFEPKIEDGDGVTETVSVH